MVKNYKVVTLCGSTRFNRESYDYGRPKWHLLETLKVRFLSLIVGATSMKKIGKVMGTASRQLAGKADGRVISEIVKKLLA